MSNSGLQQVFFDQITDTDTTQVSELGTERWQDGVKYVYVKNSTASTTVTQTGVCWENTGDYAVKPTTVKDKSLAGIVDTAIAAGGYGWLPVKGFVDASCFPTVTAGDPLAVYNTAGVLYDSTYISDIVGHAVADATSNVAKVFINLG